VRRRTRRIAWLVALLAIWAVASYIVVPLIWEEYFRHHAKLTEAARITRTRDEHPGDPINVAFVGSKEGVVRAMRASGWFPADPITLETSVRIVVDSVLRRRDDDAPVSDLFYFGRKQDLAVELPVGESPRQRHHVRLWRWDELENDRPVWYGSATFDEGVGVSHTTGQVTHHTGPDIDAERDLIARGIDAAGWMGGFRWIVDFHEQREGRNGGGDPWRTDGRLAVIALEARSVPPGAR
jgi:hypothetical protein